MTITAAPHAPPFCPNPACRFHHFHSPHWRYHRHGSHLRGCPPRRVQRYRCAHCHRSFSDQTFYLGYWLRRPELLLPLFHRLLGCSAYRQIAYEFQVAPSTVQRLASRLGRHCLLFHQRHRPHGPLAEPLVLDSFLSFEYSQYHPVAFHLAAGQHSHFFYGFTDSELRRSGRMTERQKRRRATLESRFGRPHPRATQRDVAALLATLAPLPQPLELHSDDHSAYPRAFHHLPHLTLTHHVTSSRRPRTPRNPLFPANLLDLLIRHTGAHHKRETIAFSKRRQSAAERLAVLLVWRNYLKSFSERRRDASPAMRLGLLDRRLTPAELLASRLFPSRIPLPPCWARYYRRRVPTRQIPQATSHRLRYAT